MHGVCVRVGMLLIFVLSPVAAFDLAEYRLRAATDRAAGIEEGRRALREGVFVTDPASERTLLWYMGGAAVGAADDVALDEVVAHLEALAQRHGDGVAASYSGFLRGTRRIDTGDVHAGLVVVLEAANRIATHEDVAMRITAAGELCRAYVLAGLPARASEHCRRHTRLVRESGDEVALARAEYIEASALSQSGAPHEAIENWKRARERFLAHGLRGLAARTAGALASDLVTVNRHDEALAMAGEALAAAQAADSAVSIAIARGVVADALFGLGRFAEARSEVEQAIALAEPLRQPVLLISLLRSQAVIVMASEGDPALAQRIRERIALLADVSSASGSAEQEEISTLEQTFREREQHLRISELEHDSRVKELALEQARMEADRKEQTLVHQRTVMWLAAVVSLLLLAGLAVLVRLLRAQQRLAQVLRAQAYRDALTGLPNRRALTEAIQTLLEAPDAMLRGHALLVVDVDRFKAINDQFGHPFGDTVLAAIAQRLQAAVSPHGMVARLGGEEFALLCPDRSEDQARALAEQVRRDVADLVLVERGKPVEVSVSIGGAMLGGPADDFSAWFHAADAALYRAKKAGRNRVDFASAG
ncbi:GGDEF domain-containing protein [Xanthomonadaceae bacterium JHOS43]|nr:GGDEF domain-containing protein [Xanthomonadaceae bacterium JHOS43]